MALAELARTYYAAQVALVEAVAELAAGLWALLDQESPTRSWTDQRTGERLFVAVSTAQLSAARGADQFVARAVREQGVEPAPRAALVPRSVAGVASDGRDLETLLVQPLIQAEAAISEGADPGQAHSLGGSALGTIVSTQVADAGRSAESVVMQAEPAVTGWVRMLVPPSCGRCAILAGRWYRVSAGFSRHPRPDAIA